MSFYKHAFGATLACTLGVGFDSVETKANEPVCASATGQLSSCLSLFQKIDFLIAHKFKVRYEVILGLPNGQLFL